MNWTRLDTITTPSFGTKKGEKQKSVSFDGAWVTRAWEYVNINNKKLINTLQTTLGKTKVRKIKINVPESSCSFL